MLQTSLSEKEKEIFINLWKERSSSTILRQPAEPEQTTPKFTEVELMFPVMSGPMQGHMLVMKKANIGTTLKQACLWIASQLGSKNRAHYVVLALGEYGMGTFTWVDSEHEEMHAGSHEPSFGLGVEYLDSHIRQYLCNVVPCHYEGVPSVFVPQRISEDPALGLLASVSSIETIQSVKSELADIDPELGFARLYLSDRSAFNGNAKLQVFADTGSLINVFVKTATSRIDMGQVLDLCNILELKHLIQNNHYIAINMQKILLNGKLLEDSTTLASFRTGHEYCLEFRLIERQPKSEDLEGYSVRHAEDRMEDVNQQASNTVYIYAKTLTGITIDLGQVNYLLTVEEVKHMIRDKTGIISDQQILTYAGRQLDKKHSLASYHNKSKDTITILLRLCPSSASNHVEDNPIFVFVRSLTMNCWELKNLDGGCTTLELKKLIQEIDRIPTDQQRMILDGSELEDELTLADYKIKSGCTVRLVLRLRGGGSGCLSVRIKGELLFVAFTTAHSRDTTCFFVHLCMHFVFETQRLREITI
jgi:hypothetical protein